MTAARSHSELDLTRDKSRSRGGGGLSLARGISVGVSSLRFVVTITHEAVRMRIAIVPRRRISEERRNSRRVKTSQKQSSPATWSGPQMTRRHWKLSYPRSSLELSLS